MADRQRSPDTLAEPRPNLTAATLARVLAERFGIAGELTELHSERDRNYLIVTADGTRALLKVHNPAETRHAVEMQTLALEHIATVDPGLPVCMPIPTVDGAAWVEVTANDGRDCLARLLTWLDGHHARRDELGAPALHDWGATAARLGRALSGFFHPAMGWSTPWDIKRFTTLRDWTPALGGDERRVVERLLDRFDQRVAPALAGMRGQLVHNDLSRGNVLVDSTGAISGITDFGDMTHTALVCDLAVTIADVLDGRPGSVELAIAMISGYHSVVPLDVEEVRLLADLMTARCAAAITITAWRHHQAMAPPMIGGGARELLGQLLAQGLDAVAERFVTAMGHAAVETALPYRPRSTADLQQARREVLGPLTLTYREPLHVSSAAGAYMYGANGELWLDAYNNVPVLGHAHPAVVAAVTAQLARLNTNSRYLHEAGVELAEQLIATMPGGRLDRVLLVNSGSEANDLAWRIARHATGATGGIVTRFAYHGVTTATTDFSPETWQGQQPPPPHIALVDPPPATPEVKAAAAELGQRGHRLAAMFVDGVFTSDGILGPAPEWTAATVAAVHAAGGLYVADEVQAGFGRTGDHLWSWAADGLAPDLVTLGKPMGNGYPVAAVIGSAALVDPFIEGTDYFSTYGGGTAACVAALAVLRVIAEERIVDHVKRVGEQLRADLDRLVATHDPLAACRGWGLAVGVDIVDPTGAPAPACAARITEALRDRGVLVGTTGPRASTLKIRPPLVITADDCALLVERFDDVMAGLSA
jgi:4-aminobutyrate aminotransferase-like enzyme/Ser/Thr protein kinase RdoA (MazF antagonist)